MVDLRVGVDVMREVDEARALAQQLQKVIAAWTLARYGTRQGAWAAEAYTMILSGLAFVAAYHAAALNVVGKATDGGAVGEQAIAELGEMVRTLIPIYEGEVRAGIKSWDPQ